MPRSAKSSSTSRRLRLNTWYNQTVWLMISAGKRWRWCGSGGGFMPSLLSVSHQAAKPDGLLQLPLYPPRVN
jgi:hypothetical protein